MSRTSRTAAVLAAFTALACGDIAAPVRNNLYEWRLIVPTAAGPDTIHFHWARDDLPVRVWVAGDDLESLPSLTRRAIDVWQSMLLYGEFRGELVSDSNSAHVIVRGAPAPSAAAGRITRLPSAFAPECGGATDLDIGPDRSQLRLPIRIYIDRRTSPDAPGLAECLALTAIHEMGHAMGIFAHSPSPTDIMFADPRVDLPSEFDRETAEALHHLPPTIQAVGR